ncbi:reverse transcriptase domain-containing protein [Tanacetum coccineum]
MAIKIEEIPEQEEEVEDNFEELPLEENLRIKNSSQDPPTDLVMKPLPKHLEYAFLEKESLLPVVIYALLKEDEKKRLDDDKPVIQRQRRPNPNMKEVIKKEIIKLLDAGIIYPIEDSPWFDIEIKNKKGAENVAADHFLRLENPHLEELRDDDIDNNFHDETLMNVSSTEEDKIPWFADFANDLVEPYLFKMCSYRMIRRCVYGAETQKILNECHHGPTGDTMVLLPQQKKVFDVGFYWPTIFKEAHTLVQNYDACQHSAIEYVFKWVEAEALPTNDARVVINFLKKLFSRFGIPKALISDRGEKQFLQLHELNELRLQAYKDSKLYKARTKAYHDRKLRIRKEFKAGDKVLLYNSKYKFKSPKLISKWYGPFVVKHGFPSGYVELYDKHRGSFIVNGHRVKLYHDEEQINELTTEEIHLMCEQGKMKAIPFMAPFPADYRETMLWVAEKPFIYNVVEKTCNEAKLYDLDEIGEGIVKRNFLYVKKDPSLTTINRGLIQAILTSLLPQPIREATKASNLQRIPLGVQGRSQFTYFLYLIVQIRIFFSCKFSDMEDDVDINTLTIEQYIALIPDDIKPGIVNPKIGDDVEFEINANFMRELRRKLFAGTDDEDAYEHLHTKVHIFYTGLDISTCKILDSNGFIPLMTPTQALESIQVMADHSHNWYDETTTRERINDVLDNVDGIHKSFKGEHLTKEYPLKKEDETIKHNRDMESLEETIIKFCKDTIKKQTADDEKMRKILENTESNIRALKTKTKNLHEKAYQLTHKVLTNTGEKVKAITTMGKENMKDPVPRNLSPTPFLGHLKEQIGSHYSTRETVCMIGNPKEIHNTKAQEDEGDMDVGWDITSKDVKRLR